MPVATVHRTTTRKKNPAQTQHKAAPKNPLSALYRYTDKDVNLGMERFDLQILRSDYGNLDGNRLITSLEWRYDSGDPVMHGAVTINIPAQRFTVPLHDGHIVLVRCFYGGRWQEITRLVMDNTLYQAQGQQVSADLNDLGFMLQLNHDDWHYTKTAAGGHPHGWKAHQIVRDVAKRYKIPVGKIAQGTVWITDISETDKTPLEIIQKAYGIEKQKTGKQFVVKWTHGKLNVVPLQRNILLYEMQDQIMDGQFGYEDRKDGFATSVSVRATTKKGSHNQPEKMMAQYTDKKLAGQSGFVHRVIDGSGVTTKKEAIDKAKKYIADHGVRKRKVTGLTHPGIALITRGDAMALVRPDLGFKPRDDSAVCWVDSGTWNLSAAQFTMSLDLSFDDPYAKLDNQKKKDKQVRTSKVEKKGG